MNSIIKKLPVGLLGLALFACSSDFLDTHPTDAADKETVFATTDNVKLAVNGMAYLMVVQHSALGNYCGESYIRSIFSEYLSQEFRYNYLAPGWYPIMNGDYYDRTNSLYTYYQWTYYYEIIANANTILAHADKAIGSDEEKAFYKAQALTFRAYCYEKLLELYTYRWKDTNGGTTPGVVLRLDESTGSMPLSTVGECYAQIYKDLDTAIDLYAASGMKRNSAEVWLPDLTVAYAIYARTALNRDDYPTALSMAKAARNGHPLMSNTDYTAGFCKPNAEWLFGSYADESENMWYFTWGTQFACNGYRANSQGYGAGDIEKEFSDRMPVDDLRMKLFLTVDKFPGIDVYGNSDEKDEEGKPIPHISHSSGALQSDTIYNVARAYADSITPAGLDKPYQCGYIEIGAQLKFWVFGFPGISYLCHIRASEMVLIEAEANYFLGDEAAARAALVELNATSGRNPAYTCTKSGTDLFEEIADYRELELWGEGFNWYDMKRWRRDIVRKSFAEGGNSHASTATTISADKNTWTWSIPEAETDYNDEIKK
ncbi:MAG: RagB/SusD family nutrient uptake outer membrane protein [Prevotellaceae bacterium]|jgi:hypothetical protein|nr:RagB/SusD family nutrient uptake outer membrane protein [Prevotellaceae bacterium]